MTSIVNPLIASNRISTILAVTIVASAVVSILPATALGEESPPTVTQQNAPQITQSTVYSIKQILLVRNRAVIESTAVMEPGAELIATFPDKKQCTMKIVTVKDHLANIDTSACPNAAELTVGQHLEASLLLADVIAPEAAPVVAAKTEQPPQAKEQRAAETAPQYESLITDLQYQPAAGHFAMAFEYLNGQGSGSVNNTKAVNIATVKTTQDEASAVLGYGVTSNLAIALDVGYTSSAVTDYTFGTASNAPGDKEHLSSFGASDPKLVIAYRLVDQVQFPINLDFMLGYSPKMIDSRLDTLSTQGNVARGGDEAQVGFDVGRKFSVFSLALDVIYTQEGEQTSTDPDTNIGTHYDPTHSLLAVVQGQIEANDHFSFRLSGGATNYSSERWVAQGSKAVTQDSYTQPLAQAEIILSFVPKRVAVTLGFTRLFPVSTKDRSTTEVNLRGDANVFATSLLVDF